MTQNPSEPHPRIVIVGAGRVGSTAAYALLLSGLASEIVLVDTDQKKLEGEVMDLSHAAPLTHPTRIRAGGLEDAAGARVTVLAAGVSPKPGQTRLEVLRENMQVFRRIVPEIARSNPGGIILVATNPVDVLAYGTWKLSGLPGRQVLGTGTVLDTARFRFLLSQHFGVDPRSVHAFIIGEHGDSEVPVWSLANIAGMRLQEYARAQALPCDQTWMDAIFKKTRDAAYQIIERKGATWYAVAAGILRIIEAILRDQNTVLSVSSHMGDAYQTGDVYLSLPAVVGASGIGKLLLLELASEELKAFQASARVVAQAAQGVGIS